MLKVNSWKYNSVALQHVVCAIVCLLATQILVSNTLTSPALSSCWNREAQVRMHSRTLGTRMKRSKQLFTIQCLAMLSLETMRALYSIICNGILRQPNTKYSRIAAFREVVVKRTVSNSAITDWLYSYATCEFTCPYGDTFATYFPGGLLNWRGPSSCHVALCNADDKRWATRYFQGSHRVRCSSPNEWRMTGADILLET